MMKKLTILPGIALGLLALGAPAHADHGLTGQGGSAGNVLSPSTLPKGAFAFSFGLGLAVPERRSDAELVALTADHIHAHAGDYTLTGVLGLAYGLTDRISLSASVPYVRRDRLRAGVHDHHSTVVNRAEALGTVSGLGDVRVTAQARVIDWHGGGLSLVAGLKAPTGHTSQAGDNGELLEVEHQPGSGSWDLITGAAIGGKIGRADIAVSASREWTTTGARETELGDRTLVGLSLSRTLGAMAHHDDSGEAPHGHDATALFVEATYEAEGKQEIAGAVEANGGSKAIWLSPGARREWASGWSAGAAVGVPLWQEVGLSHPDNKLRATLSLGRRF